jgi:uncharacterized protein (DUF2267 family)
VLVINSGTPCARNLRSRPGRANLYLEAILFRPHENHERISPMTWPLEYQRASQDFERFMVTARDAAGLATTNMAWTMVEGVLLAFRRRLTVSEAIEFANVLPPLLRALFLGNWHPRFEPAPFASREVLTEEVRSLRARHNFSPANAVEAVALALRSSVEEAALSQVLSKLPPQAAEFWALPCSGE